MTRGDVTVLVIMLVSLAVPILLNLMLYWRFAEKHGLSKWGLLPPSYWWEYLTEGYGLLGLLLELITIPFAIAVPTLAVAASEWFQKRTAPKKES